MEEQLKRLEWSNEDIIAFSELDLIKSSEMFKTVYESIDYLNWGHRLNQKLGSKLKISKDTTIPQGSETIFWFKDGVDCKILRLYDSQGWRNGKIRVKLNIELELWEEINESDSPLDNFREQ